MTSTSTNRPEKTIRIGSTNVAIWRRLTEDGKAFYSVQVARSYRDKEGNVQYVDSFNHDDLLNVAELFRQAQAYIADQVSQ